MGFRTAVRTAAVTLLEEFREDDNEERIKQIYPGRPKSLHPPTAYVESIDENPIDYTPAGMQRTPRVAIRFVQGNFDSADTVEGADSLIDDFIDWCVAHRHEAGPATLFLVESVSDEPDWVPEWMAEASQTYYASLVTLRGEGLFGGVT